MTKKNKTIIFKVLNFLKGKKTTTATVIGALIVFSLGRGYIAMDTAELLSTIMIALGLSANVATAKLCK